MKKTFRVWYSPIQVRRFSEQEFKEVESDLRWRGDSDGIPIEVLAPSGRRTSAFFVKNGKRIKLTKKEADKWIGPV